MKLQRTFIALAIICACMSQTSAKETMRIDKALQKGLIEVNFLSPEGYTGKIIQMKVKNLTKKSINIAMPVGLKLDSQTNSEQDLIVTKSINIELPESATKQYKVHAMCCQAHHSPPAGKYEIFGMADSNFVKLARYIETTNQQNTMAQLAMWCLSDNNPLESITGDDLKQTNNMRQYLSKLTGKKVLPFYIEYEDPDAPVFSARPSKMKGIYEFDTKIASKGTFGIYNEKGETLMTVFTARSFTTGKHKFSFEYKATGLPQGKYFARITFDNQPQQEVQFQL